MDDASAELTAADREVMLATLLEYDRWAQEAQHHKHEAERWQRRVDLAERHREFDLATEAAQRARHHAGLALAAEAHVADREAAAYHRATEVRFSSHVASVEATATGSVSSLEDRFVRQETERGIDARLAAIKAASQASVDGTGR